MKWTSQFFIISWRGSVSGQGWLASAVLLALSCFASSQRARKRVSLSGYKTRWENLQLQLMAARVSSSVMGKAKFERCWKHFAMHLSQNIFIFLGAKSEKRLTQIVCWVKFEVLGIKDGVCTSTSHSQPGHFKWHRAGCAVLIWCRMRPFKATEMCT